MKKKLVFAFVLMFLLTFTCETLAQSGFYLGIKAGYSAQKPSLTDVEFNTDTSFVYGVRAGVKFMMLALEANYFQAAHNIDLKSHVAFDEWAGRQIDCNFIGANLKYFFPILFIQPYITAGYGYYSAELKNIDKDSNTGYNFGLGLEIHLGKKFSLLAEGAYHHVRLDMDNKDLKLGNFIMSGGFNIYF
ncbi:MAG: porin family protein [Candidatus Aminicenantes bacterium]|nr:porin family protein [Candidatus Aminicenantes bacterium]